MAHADYECCAVCDTKINYNSDARAKEHICTDCLKTLHANGVMVYDGAELLEWMQNDDNVPGRKAQILKSAGFYECFYTNDVDDAYREMVKEATDER